MKRVEGRCSADDEARIIEKARTSGRGLSDELSHGARTVAQVLIERGAPVNVANKAGEDPLFVAVVQGDIEVALALIRRGADVGGIALKLGTCWAV